MINTNVGSKVTDSERLERDREDEFNEKLNRKIAASTGYETQGELNPRHAVVTDVQANWSAKDIRTRRSEGKPVIPVFSFMSDDGENHWVLTDEDAEASRLGYICENCLGWQKSNLTMECLTIKDFSCNYARGL